MIINKQKIDDAIEAIEKAKKDLKRQLAQLAEDEALFRRMKRAAESGAFKTIGEAALELRNAKEHYEAKHEAKELR